MGTPTLTNETGLEGALQAPHITVQGLHDVTIVKVRQVFSCIVTRMTSCSRISSVRVLSRLLHPQIVTDIPPPVASAVILVSLILLGSRASIHASYQIYDTVLTLPSEVRRLFALECISSKKK